MTGATRRVLYFGGYDRGPGRNEILIGALRAAGVVVDECHAGVWPDTAAKLSAARDAAGAARGLARDVSAWPRLARCHARAAPYDALIVGSTAHLDLPLARALAASRGAPLVFDPLVSIAETMRDRRLGGRRRRAAISLVERLLLRLPDLVLVDTAAHGAAFERDLGLPPGRLAVVPAGAPAEFRRAAVPYRAGRGAGELKVVYFGQFIPLHGLGVVLDAAARLSTDAGIVFELVGRGQELAWTAAEVARRGLVRVTVVDGWWSPPELAARHVAPADICLGAFGGQDKCDRVVPFKVFTAMASGRAVVTGHTRAVAELLRPGDEVWTVPVAEPAALAAAIAHLAGRPDLRERLAAAGQAAYDDRFGASALGERMSRALDEAALRAAEARARRRATGGRTARALPARGAAGRAGEGRAGEGQAAAAAERARSTDAWPDTPRAVAPPSWPDAPRGIPSASLPGSGSAPLPGSRPAAPPGIPSVPQPGSGPAAPPGIPSAPLPAPGPPPDGDEPPPCTGPRHEWRIAMVARRLVAEAPLGPLLDAGCGTGSLAVALARAGRDVAACDVDLAALRRCRARGRSGGGAAPIVVCADVRQLPFASGAFAGAAVGEVLEHVHDDLHAAAEIARVLAPGGALVVTVPAGPGRLGEADRRAGHVRRYLRRDLADLLSAAGCERVSVRGWGLPFGRLYDAVVQRPVLARRDRAAGRLARRVARGPAAAIWRRAFEMEERCDAGDRGSGLLAVARRASRRP